MTVLFSINFDKAFFMITSFSGSIYEVASSSMTIGESFNIALAIDILCLSPPET